MLGKSNLGRFGAATTGALMLCSVSAANAAVIQEFSDRTAFTTAAGAPLTNETFSSFIADTPFHTTPLDIGLFTISMTGSPPKFFGNKIDVVPIDGSFGVDGTNTMGVFTRPGQSLILTFESPIFAFGADFYDWNDDLLRTDVIVGGADVLSPPIDTTSPPRFYGFISDMPFTTVEFRGLENDVYGMDNLAFGGAYVGVPPVPEPGTLAIFGPSANWKVRRD